MSRMILIATPSIRVCQSLSNRFLVEGFETIFCVTDYQTYLVRHQHAPLDAILLDVALNPVQCVCSEIGEIKADHPDSKILLLSQDPQPHEAAHAIAAGADGYLYRADFDAVVKATVASVEGVALFDNRALKEAVLPMANLMLAVPFEGNERVGFTSAELRTLNHLATGLSNQAIADQLDLSINTVKTHVRHILQKLAVPDRTQAALWAARHGFPQRQYHP